MKKNLSKEQVSKLYAFCKEMEIYDFDVQIEVVDHLASTIESQWKTEPEISFDSALKNSLQKFGKNGIHKLERKLIKQMKHNFNLILLRYVFKFFKLPKILTTIVVAFVLFVAFQLAGNNMWVIMPFCIFFFIASIIYYYKIFPEKYKLETGNKSYMIHVYLKNINAWAGSVAQLPFMALLFSESLKLKYSYSPLAELLISVFLAVLVVFMYAYFVYLPKHIKNYFETNYLQFAR